WVSRVTPATTRRKTASPLMLAVARSPRATPSMSRIMAPAARISSGRIGWSDGTSRISVIAGPVSVAEQRGLGAARGERVVIVVDQRRHRGGRHLEHRLRIDAEQDRQRDERREDRDLARPEVENGGERGLFQLAKDHLAVEPERVSRGQDQPEGGEDRHGGVDLEGADEREELADEAGGA